MQSDLSHYSVGSKDNPTKAQGNIFCNKISSKRSQLKTIEYEFVW